MINATTVTSETIITLRRRLVDKLCKDNFFAIDVIGYAIRKGKIRYHDIVNEKEAQLLTQPKVSPMKQLYVHHKEDEYTVYFTVEDCTFMAVSKNGTILFPPPAKTDLYL